MEERKGGSRVYHEWVERRNRFNVEEEEISAFRTIDSSKIIEVSFLTAKGEIVL